MTEDTLTTRQEALLAGLAQHTGTTRWRRHWSKLLYTDGVAYLADQAGAYWLIDLVASWQGNPALRRQGFIVWTLTVNPDRTAVAQATNGNMRPLARQEIPATDFPLPEITLYLTDGVLLLPSEY